MEGDAKLAAVLNMQRYIKAHLEESITLADLARVSFYSPWYAHRLFVAALNMAPAEYIRRFRLSQSALKLRDERVTILDVAFALGFGSVDGYQRAFFKEFGCNPSEYAKNPIPLRLFTPYEIEMPKERKEKCMEKVKSVFIQVVEKPKRDVIIKRGVAATDYFAYCEEVGCDVWGILLSIKSISGEPVSMWLPKAMIKSGTSEYVQGVEVEAGYDGHVPDGFEVIHLPKCKYLMFQGEPFNEEDYCEAIEELQAAIKKYDPAIGGFAWDLKNPRIQLEPQGARGYIELLPVK
jgi:AraC-type DNA-binding domain-containing proteins